MVIGWIFYSRDLFETYWKGLHEVLPNVIVEDRACLHFASVALLSFL